ncbi:hypothetical protein FRC03_006722 [Tulasnella sp. 419]|nr:hypothetical protein FRC03_006722 [Tulasnella sp. 419]
MAELQALREETLKARKEAGTEDGADEKGEAKGAVNKTAEKRKRELEERRRLLDAKRRKATSSATTSDQPAKIHEPDAVKVAPITERHLANSRLGPSSVTPSPREASSASTAADDFLANLERELGRKGS